jgi:hypothetical protein
MRMKFSVHTGEAHGGDEVHGRTPPDTPDEITLTQGSSRFGQFYPMTKFSRHAPKFEKRMHHVVPVAWQKRFALPGDRGPYYLNVRTGKKLNAQGPAKKMAEEYANIVFDEYFRPSDKLEDSLSATETKTMEGLDRTIATSIMDPTARLDIAYLLAIQACRYPERFQHLLDLGRYLAIALNDFASLPDASMLNAALQSTGILPGANITPEEFEQLKASPKEELATQLEQILRAHGYEAYFNPELIFRAAAPVAIHLLNLKWDLIESDAPAFILSDRPVPVPLKFGFGIGLSANLGLLMSEPKNATDNGPIRAWKASPAEIEAINQSARSSAREWICGPGPWVHAL